MGRFVYGGQVGVTTLLLPPWTVGYGCYFMFLLVFEFLVKMQQFIKWLRAEI
jgi:hypothetical protein